MIEARTLSFTDLASTDRTLPLLRSERALLYRSLPPFLQFTTNKPIVNRNETPQPHFNPTCFTCEPQNEHLICESLERCGARNGARQQDGQHRTVDSCGYQCTGYGREAVYQYGTIGKGVEVVG